ncbi:MAG: hypothetical protein AB7S81_01735 [Bdellovibrionales bacterium]
MRIFLLVLLLLSSSAFAEEPDLPLGLGGDEIAFEETETDQAGLPFDVTGFVETRLGVRAGEPRNEKDVSIGEGRLHLEAVSRGLPITFNFSGDALYDPVFDDYDVDLESGKGWFDLREANAFLRASSNADLKIGRQILTWGTGDLLFINDMFPKDWNSFFLGRDEAYLKAPSDALKTAFYSDFINLDVVYTPRFDADRFIDGRHVSYYNGNLGYVAGRDNPVIVDQRQDWFSEDEIALRFHRMIGAYEAAAYLYSGYWKSPHGQHAGGDYIFPALSVYGASMRGPLAGGIVKAEAGYYDSRDDRAGTNALIDNSEWRGLVGYEREVAPELTAAAQYYLEAMQDYGTYKTNLPAGSKVRDEYRHVITTRLTKLLMNQNMTLSLFNFYSPSDRDGYLRASTSYKVNDHLTLSLGGNWFYGAERHTFFGQFQENSNVYASARWGF